MKLSTTLVAVGTSAVMGVTFALLLPIAPMIIYVITGVNINIK